MLCLAPGLIIKISPIVVMASAYSGAAFERKKTFFRFPERETFSRRKLSSSCSFSSWFQSY